MKGHKGIWGIIIFLSLFSILPAARGEVLQEIFTEDFEFGQGDWEVSNGVWQVGEPTSGPSACHGGDQCAGTVLDGDYPTSTDSRLISPQIPSPITLPPVSGNEEIRLRFWQWFSYSSGDSGHVQVSEFDVGTGWSDWITVDLGVGSVSGGWSRKDVDLTDYAGKQIRIAFNHVAVNAGPGVDESSGWYIDDIEVLKMVPEFSGDFEDGWGDWSAETGVWQIGVPDVNVGPGECHEGVQCAGTVLDGVYPTSTDSRLISATMTLPTVNADEEIHLRYWQWFSYSSGDSGHVQVSEFDAGTGWSDWITVDLGVGSVSGGWSRKDVDLTDYAGKQIRIAFNHVAVNAGPGVDESSGWYIDDIEVLKMVPEFSGDFEDGWGDWSAETGVWQIGVPDVNVGPGECHEGVQCAGTVLDGVYPTSTDSRLISATMTLPTVNADEEIHLRYWQWFSYSSGDSGHVQVSEFDAGTGWSDWITVDLGVGSVSGGWSRKDVDLTDYAGKQIRIAFNHVAVNAGPGVDESSGWYIDDIEVLKMVPEFSGDFEDGWGDWSAETGVWQIGMPASGPGVCRAGVQCAGTVLEGNYPVNTDSRLISPPLWLPEVVGDEGNALRFWHWFSYSTGDLGYVQISVYDSDVGWSAWTNIGGPYTGVSGGWSRVTAPLNAYSGSKIRLAFSHVAVNAVPGVDESSGWYVDQVRLPGVYLAPCEGDFDNDGDVDGSDLGKFSDNFGRVNCSLDDFCTGDFDNDGDVDGTDLAKFSEDFGNTPEQCFATP